MFQKMLVRLLSFLGTFAKLRKETVSFLTYVCLSVCPFVRLSVRSHATTSLPILRGDIPAVLDTIR